MIHFPSLLCRIYYVIESDKKYLRRTVTLRNNVGEKLVEDVVVTLDTGLLIGYTGLLKQVRLDVATSDTSRRAEVDTDELSLY